MSYKNSQEKQEGRRGPGWWGKATLWTAFGLGVLASLLVPGWTIAGHVAMLAVLVGAAAAAFGCMYMSENDLW